MVHWSINITTHKQSTQGAQIRPRVLKLFSCFTQLSMKFPLLLKTKIPKREEISCFKFLRCGIYHANKCCNANNRWYYNIYKHHKFRAKLRWAWKKFYILGARMLIKLGMICLILFSLYLHLCCFIGVVITFPRFPVYTISIRSMISTEVFPIQIWFVTSIIPPCPMIFDCTIIDWVWVIFFIFGCKFLTILFFQWISWKEGKIKKTKQPFLKA